jgi:site-specific recombinase XerD
MAPATINRAIAALRGFGAWLLAERIVSENPMGELKDLPLDPPAPRSIPSEAIDALLRAVRAEPDERLRDEAILALLAYAGLRVQEACDVQLRDLGA